MLLTKNRFLWFYQFEVTSYKCIVYKWFTWYNRYPPADVKHVDMTAKAMTKLFFSFFTLKKAKTDLNISFIERYIDDFTTLCFTYYVHVFVSFPKQMCKFGDKKQYNIWIGFGVYTFVLTLTCPQKHAAKATIISIIKKTRTRTWWIVQDPTSTAKPDVNTKTAALIWNKMAM